MRSAAKPAFACRHVRDVADPDLVRALELEIELLVEDGSEVALHARARVADRRHAGLDPVGAHEASNPVLADPMAALAKSTMHPRAAVGTAALGVYYPDLGRQRLVLALTLATLARAPGVETRPRHPVEPTHQPHAVLSPVYFDELEDLRFRPEANRMTFFRSSCSSLSTL